MSSSPFFKHRRAFLIPLDARPVCYAMPERLAASAGLALHLPTPRQLGQLKQPADSQSLMRWVKNNLFENDPVIAALDTIAYGGLIPSRVGHESEETVLERLAQFFDKVNASTLYGFSSILRIPSYNNAEEEPDYWADYGSALYAYSYQSDADPAAAEALGATIPAAVLADFLGRRERNFTVNQKHLWRLQRGDLDYLTYCQDDTGPYGLNVIEARQLAEAIARKKCAVKAHVQTGADEVAAMMLARLLSQWRLDAGHAPLTICPQYSAPDGAQVMARFDGQPIGAVVSRAIQTALAEETDQPEAADIRLLVHTPSAEQGDHCESPWKFANANFSGANSPTEPAQRERIIDWLATARSLRQPVALADVAYANGSDAQLAERLLNQNARLGDLYGYAGWNTPGNTIGTSVAMAVTRRVAEQNGSFDAGAFSRLLAIRLGDDWLYQSTVRKHIRHHYPNGHLDADATRLLNVEMAAGLALIKQRLGLSEQASACRFPCNRTFEVEITL